MRRLLSVCLLLAATCPANAQQKPNTLTPKEIADGWILLFDGESTYGWKSDRDGPKAADGQRDSKNTEIVVVYLITKASVSGLIQTFELVQGDGKTIRHDETVEEHGETCLAKSIHLLCFTEDF